MHLNLRTMATRFACDDRSSLASREDDNDSSSQRLDKATRALCERRFRGEGASANFVGLEGNAGG